MSKEVENAVEVWEVTMWKNVGTIEDIVMEWVTEKRYYYTHKTKEDFDLYEIDGLRKEVKRIK